MVKILFLVSALNAGDMSHMQSLENNFPEHQIEVIDTSQEDALAKYNSNIPADNEKYITIAIGPSGKAMLQNLADDLNNYRVLSTHQYTKDIGGIITAGKINHLAVPEATLNFVAREAIRGINSSMLFAVPTKNPDLDELTASYEVWNIADKPSLEEKYIIVTLPGDAPIAVIEKPGDVSLSDGSKVRLFNEESALELFNFVKSLWQEKGRGHRVLIQNSPRTGKYAENGSVVGEHRGNRDHISNKFVDWLCDNDISFEFFDFTFNQKSDEKSYNPLLYIATQGRDNYYITPGESVSMMGQIPLYIDPLKHIVFKPSSMNEAHEAVCKKASERGYFSTIDEFGVVSPENPRMRETDDASELAQDIARKFEEFSEQEQARSR